MGKILNHRREAERLFRQADEWMDADLGWKARLTVDERVARRTADLLAAQVAATLALVDVTAQAQPVAKEKDTRKGESTPQPTTTSSARAEYIGGLRQFADWLEQHPDVEAPTGDRMLLPLTTNPAVEEFAAAHDLVVKVDSNGNTEAALHFGPITYVAYGYADFDKFCEQSAERQARQWAAKNSLVIQSHDGGDS
jgi:hypothetical protein